MKLSELNPGFVSNSTGTRIGAHFLCPKCKAQQIYIPTHDPDSKLQWGVSGDLESLTLSPSVDSKHTIQETAVECRWHGWIQNGEVREA